MSTPLQLSGYVVTHMLMRVREEFDGRQGYECSMDIDPTHMVHNEDENVHQLILRVVVGASENDPTGAPYEIEIEGRAVFRIDPSAEIDDAQKKKLVILNGSAILLGLLRGQVSQLTAQAPHRMFLLPPVNLVEAFRDKFGAREQQDDVSGDEFEAAESPAECAE